ncbi:piggyBac transposable element-derived protein 4-like [Homalodisca vitripennis]|uniref:piggyBac transposable element-derived protein 4-like n=1 Tax=Homalodisca vitripennis TaxID=197043 RepID=UPI001EEB1704|nr:piggyBac transposable element-derived protein 4-like [Homalodisca vitripennis]
MESLNEDEIARLLWVDNEDEHGERHDANIIPQVMEEELEESDVQPADAVAIRMDEEIELGPLVLGKNNTTAWSVVAPTKRGKYGIKFVMMNDAKTYYMCDAIPYVGEVTDKLPNELVPEYYVRKLSESISGTKRNITCDNWFTTVPLVDRMLERELTMIGTLRKNKPQIPPCLFQERAVNSCVFVFDANKTLVSFSPKRKKNVVLVSSMHHDDTIDEETGKPEIIIVYNKNKGGTDSFDKLCATFSTSRKNLRWPMQVVYGMLDQGGVNAYVLFVLANPQWKEKKQHNRRFFLKDLSSALTREHMIARSQQGNIPRQLKLQIKAILSYNEEREDQEAEEDQEEQPDNKQKRCYMCDRKKDRKSKSRCNGCKKPVCKDHSVDLCKNCSD